MKKILSYSFFSILLLFTATSTSIAQIIQTVAGIHSVGYCCDGGAATNAGLVYPSGVATDLSGNFYIFDIGVERIRMVNSSGIISTVAGTGITGYSGDGGPATNAKLNLGKYAPGEGGIATDNAGNLYISDSYNNRIRKINTSGIITTIAGNGTAGFSGDGGPATAALLDTPGAMTVDLSGNIYIVDGYSRIRKIDMSGIITTIAGGGFGGDGGPATAAQLSYVLGIAVDCFYNVFITHKSAGRVRKITPSGIISTYAGGGTVPYFASLGGPATSASLSDDDLAVSVDAAGNLYISRWMNVAKVSTSGIITNVAGGVNSIPCSGDGGPATSAGFNEVCGVTIDVYGNMYIASSACANIRFVPGAGVSAVLPQNYSEEFISVYPNPAHDILNISVPTATGTITLFDISGKQVLRQSVTEKISTQAVGSLPSGTYFAVWNDGAGNRVMQKFLLE